MRQLGGAEEGAGAAEEEWVTGVLLRRLADDDAGVVFAVVESPLLLGVPAAALFDALAAAIRRATAALHDGAAEDKSGFRGVARKVGHFRAAPMRHDTFGLCEGLDGLLNMLSL